MKLNRPASVLAASLLTAALVGGTTPALGLVLPEAEPQATTSPEPAPADGTAPAAPAVPQESSTTPAPSSPSEGPTAPTQPAPQTPGPDETSGGTDGAPTDAAEMSPEELARNASALADLIGPLGASLGQGVERIAETGDPQVPTDEELTQIAQEERSTSGNEATPGAVQAVPEADQAGAMNRSTDTDFPMARTAFQPLVNYWKPAGILGVDVSSHQGNVDWAAAWRQGSRFAYTKATEALVYKNPYFASQYKGAEVSGMDRGAYHFAIPNVSSGAAQADYFIRNGGGWSADGKTLPPLLDVEYNPYPELGNTCYNMSPAQMVNWIRDFSNTMLSRTGRLPMIYTTADWWNRCTGYSTAFANHPLHVASYNNCCTGPLPAGWRVESLWQYTSDGPVVGDWNRWNGTAAAFDRFVRGGYTAPAPAPAPVVLDKTLAAVNAGDFNRNGTHDLVSRRPDGTLWFHDGTGTGSFRAPVKIGSGWGIYSQLIGGQDFNADGRPDLVGRKTDGTLWFYAGTGVVTATAEGYRGPVKSGVGWNAFDIMVSPGDFTGDRRPDLIARKPDGTLWLYRGTGISPDIVNGAVRIGTGGWTGFNLLSGAGDYTGDGRADLLARKPDGALWLYQGTGNVSATSTGYLPGRAIATGWAGYSDIVGASDFNRDGKTDLVGFRADMSLWFFAGTAMKDNGYRPGTRIGSTGWQNYNTIVGPGDFNANGTKDLIARRKDGTLWFYNGTGRGAYGTPIRIGSAGWNTFTDILAPGDLNGDRRPDLLARHQDGSLWFYAGTGTVNTTSEGYKPGQKIGQGGWQAFSQLMAPGDYNSDGRPDLLGRKTDGTLWFWAGTGTISATSEGYGSAVQIGRGGWQGFNHVITPGDFTGDKRNDLLARKPDGTLWLYAGTGAASPTQEGYKPAVPIGTGWNNATTITGPGDFNGDTKADLLTTRADGSLWFYAGTHGTNAGYNPAKPAGKL
ncbi:VCBS repeat-containing protein [Arthrobacter sp. MSA 4-2]|uniref:GH25 family lysozyme n=1 Tax=Arthrobacter sp. MSA 4-2 TaxID=2794349 RepID=UPI0018E73280|nr:GH25 family lysozyme [Arthrobacter sp. MSA 4-2]MBJ2120962.1 VCBS repeat-containing protein [Arthrobacter sp. MSA 4-2]